MTVTNATRPVAGSAPDTITVRPARPGDLVAVAAIYGHHAATGTGTFEEHPPDAAEMVRRYETIVDRGLPYLVALQAEHVCGFAYAAPFRPRSAYRFTVEDSIYIDPAVTGRGIGRRLLARLIGHCEESGYRQMVAVIGDSTNAASIGLHASQGFAAAGQLTSVGFKFGRWVDVVFMVRPLGEGDGNLPSGLPGF